MMGIDDPRMGPFARGSDTSREAAVKNYPRSGTQRRAVYDAIVAAGEEGLTRDEVSGQLGLADSAADPRVLELKRDGFIVETQRTRQTRRGSSARVLVAADLAEPAPAEPEAPATLFDLGDGSSPSAYDPRL